MPNIEKIRSVLNDMRPKLMDKQNVVATGIGYKSVKGRLTEDLAIVCSVEVKKDKAQLSRRDLIPAQVGNTPTDVRQTAMLRAFQDPTDRFRPAPGGVSIGHVHITAGTLGCLVQKNGTTYILSNNHVLANSNDASPGDPILQPGPIDGGDLPADQIAQLSEFIPINFEGSGNGKSCRTAGAVAAILNAVASAIGSSTRLRQIRMAAEDNQVDCAIAEPIDASDVSNEILDIGTINGTAEGILGMEVKKSGRTTGFTTGVIQQVDVTARVNYGSNKVATFTDQLMAGSMSQGGDSGSAVLDNQNNLVGLLFAGSDTTTIINRIQNVFAALDVSLP